MDRFGAPIREASVLVASDGGLPTGLAIAGGAVVVVGAAFVAALVPVSAGAVRLGIVAAGVGVFAAATVDPAAVAAVGVLAYLVFDGFLVNQLGELSWHGGADVQRLYVFIVVSIVGLVTGGCLRALREWRRWRLRGRWLAATPDGTAVAAGQVLEEGTAPAWQDVKQPAATTEFMWRGREISRG